MGYPEGAADEWARAGVTPGSPAVFTAAGLCQDVRHNSGRPNSVPRGLCCGLMRDGVCSSRLALLGGAQRTNCFGARQARAGHGTSFDVDDDFVSRV